jgi:hypothetical protein
MPVLNVWCEKDHALTGRKRPRLGRERIGVFKTRVIFVVQVEEKFTSYNACNRGAQEQMTRWRDACVSDFANVETLNSLGPTS